MEVARRVENLQKNMGIVPFKGIKVDCAIMEEHGESTGCKEIVVSNP